MQYIKSNAYPIEHDLERTCYVNGWDPVYCRKLSQPRWVDNENPHLVYWFGQCKTWGARRYQEELVVSAAVRFKALKREYNLEMDAAHCHLNRAIHNHYSCGCVTPAFNSFLSSPCAASNKLLALIRCLVWLNICC